MRGKKGLVDHRSEDPREVFGDRTPTPFLTEPTEPFQFEEVFDAEHLTEFWFDEHLLPFSKVFGRFDEPTEHLLMFYY